MQSSSDKKTKKQTATAAGPLLLLSAAALPVTLLLLGLSKAACGFFAIKRTSTGKQNVIPTRKPSVGSWHNG